MFTGFGNTIGWVFSKEFRTLVKNKEIVIPGMQYAQVFIFSLLALAIPTVGIMAAYHAGVHEFFDPQTYSVVTAYAPYGKQTAAMVFAVALFILVYSVVFIGWFPAIMSRFGWTINALNMPWGYLSLPVIGAAALIVRREAVFPEYLMADDDETETGTTEEEQAQTEEPTPENPDTTTETNTSTP